MATTTNYGWTTPDDTALVKDGAAAIRTLGSSIDSTLKTQIDAQIPDSLLTTKGDLIAATGASTPARLASSAVNNEVLTVDTSTATGLKWATPPTGSLTLLSTTTLSGAITTISSISGSYTHLFLYIYGMTNATATGRFRIAPNGNTAISNNLGPNATNTVTTNPSDYLYAFGSNSSYVQPLFTSNLNAVSLTIYNYSSTAAYKTFSGNGILLNGSSTQVASFVTGGIQTTSAITSLDFSNLGGNLSTGTVLLYGVK